MGLDADMVKAEVKANKLIAATRTKAGRKNAKLVDKAQKAVQKVEALRRKDMLLFRKRISKHGADKLNLEGRKEKPMPGRHRKKSKKKKPTAKKKPAAGKKKAAAKKAATAPKKKKKKKAAPKKKKAPAPRGGKPVVRTDAKERHRKRSAALVNQVKKLNKAAKKAKKKPDSVRLSLQNAEA